MERQAVIFDFDSCLYGKDVSWRVQDPRLGMSGALRDASTVVEFLQSRRHERDFCLTDHYQHLEPGFVDSRHAEGLALLPLEHVAPTAQQHRFRGREMFLLTWTRQGGMEGILRNLVRQSIGNAARSSLPYQKGNPLDAAELLELRPADLEGLHPTEGLALARFRRLRSLLSITEGPQAERPGPFDRLFVYTADPVLALLLDRFILEFQDRFTAGRNALLPAVIAHVTAEAMLAARAQA